MTFKEALGIENPDWTTIGQHLGKIVTESIESNKLIDADIANYLRKIGHQYIEHEFVSEYMSGQASFGVFFPAIQNYLEIPPEKIFLKGKSEESKKNLGELFNYLTNNLNLESLIIFLKHKPGEEMRNHISNLLKQKRNEFLEKPYHSVNVGFKSQLRNEQEVMQTIDELFKKSGNETIFRYEINNEDNPEEFQNILNQIKEGTDELYHKKLHIDTRIPEIIDGSKIVIQKALLNGKNGYTIGILYPTSYADELIKREIKINEGTWIEAYTKGTFTDFKSTDDIANIGWILEFGINQFVPTREPTEAERYEIHQRWLNRGGTYIHGVFLGTEEQLEKNKVTKPNPEARTIFEEQAYEINSNLTISIGLFEHIKDLVNG